MEELKILIVDGHEGVFGSIKDVLGTVGFNKVFGVTKGEDAFVVARDKRINVVLISGCCLKGGIDAVELCKFLKQKYPKCFFVGMDFTGDRLWRFGEAGFDFAYDFSDGPYELIKRLQNNVPIH